MRKTLSLGLILGLISPLAHAAPKRGESGDDKLVVKPYVSKEGVQRILDAIETVQANVKDTQQNLTLCEKNRAVVIAELKELDRLETEQSELIVRYKSYLTIAREMIAKNEGEADVIRKWEKENKGKSDTMKGAAQVDLASKMNNARLDKEQRAKWKADAEAKVARVSKLLAEAEGNLKNIQARRAPLKGQANGWVEKQTEFKLLLKELAARKEELTRLAETKKKELPPDDSGQ